MRALSIMERWLLRGFVGGACSGCTSFPDPSDWWIDEPRLIGVIADPPEVRPGQDVTYRLIAAGPSGALEDFAFDASYCESPKPLTVSNSVSEACLVEGGRGLAMQGATATGPVPSEACALFGPEPPPGDFRPRDPDGTGGFFAPVRVRAFDKLGIVLQRIRCAPADVDADLARAFSAQYVSNTNPHSLTLRVESEIESGIFALSVFVPESSAERYVRIDPEARRLVEAREELTVDWYSNAGALEAMDRALTIREGEARANARVIAEPGRSTTVWTIVRDSRGGSAAAHVEVQLR